MSDAKYFVRDENDREYWLCYEHYHRRKWLGQLSVIQMGDNCAIKCDDCEVLEE